MERPTVGQVSSDLLQRDVYGDITAGEQMREQLAEYEQFLHECVSSGKAQYSGDFFVVVLTKRERLMANVFRNYFFARQSCPTPSYDQTVFHYHREGDELEFLWTLPNPAAIKNLLVHKHELDPSCFELLRMVLAFLDGDLDKKAQVLNGETLLKKEMQDDGRIQTGRDTGRG
jgi:hypothetical protein